MRGELHEERLTESIIGAFYEVYNILGFELAEYHYSAALENELRLRGHHVDREIPFEVWYKGTLVGRHRIDLLVDGIVVIESKATYELHPSAARQCFSYLRASGRAVGLVLHFGPKPNVKRLLSRKDGSRRYTAIRDERRTDLEGCKSEESDRI
jgi:GxxExxY protein